MHPTRESVEEFPLGQGMSSGQTGLVKVAKVSVGANRTYPPQVGTTAIIGSRLPTDDTSSVQLLMCPTPCDPMNRSTPGLPVPHQLLEFTQTHVHRVCDAIQPSHPHSSPSPPAPNPSQHQSLSNESTLLMRWPKYWSFSFSIIPSKEIPGLISFRMDWLDLLAAQGTLKSLLQHHSSILRRSAFFTVQLSHPYMTPGKTIALIDGP